MSRVEEDREAARLQERLLQEKAAKEAKAKGKAAADSAFSKRVEQGQTFREMAERQGTQSDQANAKGYQKAEKGVMQSVLAQAKAEQQQKTTQHQTARAQSKAGDGERLGESRLAAGDSGAQVESRQQDAGKTEDKREMRQADAKVTHEQLDSREGEEPGAAPPQGGGAAREKGGVKSDADGGGSQGDGKDDGKKGSEAAMAASLRFNPALMAPPAVAKPRDMGASERLRALANEIAQKIVERVRVGTNAAGASEFQIDLRSNVLKGLSIKVSGGNGKIRLAFSGNDREVLKLIREQGEGLKSALRGRGLVLEDFKVEERA